MIRYLVGIGLALWALVMALGPDPGFSAPWPWMALFWALQIGIGLTVLQSALYLTSRADKSGRIPLWLMVLASGVCGVVVLTPLYWLIGEGLMQQVLGFAATIDDDDDLRSLQPVFGVTALVEELGDIAGPVLSAWVLISWPRLQGLLPPLVDKSTVESEASAGEASAAVSADSPRFRAATANGHWRAALPGELGDDVIAVKSELQYLRVWTARGCALVLGSLHDVEASEGVAGMRVHRSWWVHARHVRSVRRSGDGALCELSDGREVPVSRRRKSDVLARFGDGAHYAGASAASGAPPSAKNQNNRRNPT